MKFVITGKETTHPFNKHWQHCVGSDHAKQAMRTDYVKQLKQIHDELGIKYVRFHGIFNDDMETVNDMSMMVPVPGLENFTEYNFHNCGVVYDNVLAAGMKPFVELSFMPSLLASGDTHGSMWYVKNVTPPADYEKWADYIRKFIEFLLHRYGAEEVETWYFEVWNEPDLAPTFFSGTQKDYFQIYETTARAIKEVNANLRVGGPSTSGSKWVRSFRAFCEKNEIPLDFLSTHQYAGDPLGGIEGEGIVGEQENTEEQILDLTAEYVKSATHLMPEMQQIEEKTYLNGWQMMMPDKTECEDLPDYVFRTNSAIVRKQAEGYPLFYTEWNMNPKEIQDLIDRSAVREEEIDIDFRNGQLQIEAELGVNDVYFYRVVM